MYVPQYMFPHRALWLLLAACLLLGPSTATASQATPEATVDGFNDVLVKALKDGPNLGYDGRFQLIGPEYDERFAWQAMGRFAAGKFWRDFSEQEQKTYLKAYRDWSVATYADRFREYKGQSFAVLPADTAGEVVSRITKADGDTVDLTYKLRKSRDKWLIVDVRVRGISQLAMTRSQFISTLEKDGLAGLLTQLEEKTVQMSTDEAS